MPRRSSRVSRRINGVGSDHSHSSDIDLSDQEDSHVDIIKVPIAKECSQLIRIGCRHGYYQTSLIKAGQSVEQLQKQFDNLRRENEKLNNRLRVQNAPTKQNKSPRRARSRKEDIDRINALETKIEKLKILNTKNRQRIDQLQLKEAKEEADDLQQTAEEGALDDSAYRMRKLLRRFNDLMLVVTLGKEEDCQVCFEGLKLRETSSMPCEHLICNTCLPGISRGSDETVLCPTCRRRCERDDIMLVEMDEISRWDALLGVAQAFSAMDTRGEMEAEEEEDEENFIDDRSEAENTLEQQPSTRQSAELPQSSEESAPRTPESQPRCLYSQSPTKDKRRRMERLAEERANKRSRN